MLPNVIFVGPRKTGTTSIYSMLCKNDNVYVNKNVKEIYYFDKFYENGERWYKKFYINNNEESIIAEVSPSYFDKEDVIERIYSLLPKAKIVITLRSPVERTRSDYFHHLRYGYFQNKISELKDADLENIIKPSKYSYYIDLWRRRFGGNNVLILYIDDMRFDEELFYDKISEFIGEKLNIYNLESENQGGSIGNPKIARVITKLTLIARGYRLNYIINFLKSLGLKKSIYKSKKIKKEDFFSSEDEMKILNILENEVVQYENRRY